MVRLSHLIYYLVYVLNECALPNSAYKMVLFYGTRLSGKTVLVPMK